MCLCTECSLIWTQCKSSYHGVVVQACVKEQRCVRAKDCTVDDILIVRVRDSKSFRAMDERTMLMGLGGLTFTACLSSSTVNQLFGQHKQQRQFMLVFLWGQA